MPIYEYSCTNCGHNLNKLQKMNEAPIKECPACNKSTLVKKISGAGFILKGTGWYVTDFKDKNKPEKQSSNISKNDADKGGEHGNHKRGDENKDNDKKEAIQEKSSPAYSNKDSASSSNGTTTNAVEQTSKESGKGVTA